MRNVPAALQTHLDGTATTTCYLLKIKTKAESVFGLTTLDAGVAYDDGSGDGEVSYIATNGFDASALRADLGVSVDNAESYALISDEVESDEIGGITEEMIDAGELDDADWAVYKINYKDTTPGRHVEIGSGNLGEVRTRHGLVFIPELLDTMAALKQPIGEVYSRRCRATFGLPATEENRHRGCGVDADALWVAGEVQSVGAETNRNFTGDAVATPHSFPGRVRFTTGSNAGREYATDSVDGFVIELVETTAYPIQAGDEYEIRPDCGKRYELDCIGVWSNGPNFKGEPHIPDGSEVSAPR